MPPGPPPNRTRRRTNVPAAGDWQKPAAIGWQHGDVPPAPAGVSKAARDAWLTWMDAWFASFWVPADLPALVMLCRLYSKVMGGKVSGSERSELRQLMKAYGISPEGQQSLRWARPEGMEDEPEQKAPAAPAAYAQLKVVG